MIHNKERSNYLIKKLGEFCPSSYLVRLSIDVHHKKFINDPAGAFGHSLAHELYHAARFHSKTSRACGTFLQNLVDEGLADQFVLEATGTLPVWNRSLSKLARSRLMRIIKRKLHRPLSDSEYNEWFIYGSKRQRIPRWAGYSLGLYLVSQYIAHRLTASARTLMATPARQFWFVGSDGSE